MLPIYLPQFEWNSLEKKLITLANKEKEDLEPKDRDVHKVLPMAQYLARHRKYGAIQKLLESRNIIKVGFQPNLIVLLTCFKMARVLILAMPSPKKTAPRQSIAKKYKTRLSYKKPKHGAMLLRLLTMRIMAKWLAMNKLTKVKELKGKRFAYPTFYGLFGCYVIYLIIKVLSSTKRNRRGRQFTQSIKNRLCHKNSRGSITLRSLETIRIHPEVRCVLDEFRLLADALKVKCKRDQSGRRKISKTQLDEALNDNWQPVGIIAKKLGLTFREATKLLQQRKEIHEIYHYSGGDSPIALYSRNPDATHIERDWLTLNEAFQLAKERGYEGGLNTFRKNNIFRYERFNLEFRHTVPEYENCLLRWRDKAE